MDRPIYLHLNANRYITGTLRGYDMFLNLVVDDATEDAGAGEKIKLGTTVSEERKWSRESASKKETMG